MEPIVSVPMARGAKPAATETAEPVDDPPGAYTTHQQVQMQIVDFFVLTE